MNYLEQYEASRGEQDPTERQSRLDTARNALSGVLSDLFHPTSPTQKEEVSAIDREGDTAMKDTEGQNDGTSAEVVTIPITVEDELSDIPTEMRETVAKEIAAFRERSNRRDIERLKREEEIESMERARNAGPRTSRLASPPPTAPSGPAAGANGVPVGPRDRSGVPSGPKGFVSKYQRTTKMGSLLSTMIGKRKSRMLAMKSWSTDVKGRKMQNSKSNISTKSDAG